MMTAIYAKKTARDLMAVCPHGWRGVGLGGLYASRAQFRAQ